MNRNGSTVIIVMVLVLALMVVGVFWYFSSRSSVKNQAVQSSGNLSVAATAGLSSDEKVALEEINSVEQYLPSIATPNLYLTPVPLAISPSDSSGYPHFSYYGLTLAVPWKEQPKISSGSFGTSLRFSNGKSIVIPMASQVIPSWRATYLSVPPPSGLSPTGIMGMFNNEYGANTVPNYAFVGSILNSTPNKISTDTASLVASFADAAFLVDKQPLLFVTTSTALYNFVASNALGFESIGQATDNGISTNVAYFYVFQDAADTAHDFVTYGLTQTDINFILASLKVN